MAQATTRSSILTPRSRRREGLPGAPSSGGSSPMRGRSSRGPRTGRHRSLELRGAFGSQQQDRVKAHPDAEKGRDDTADQTLEQADLVGVGEEPQSGREAAVREKRRDPIHVTRGGTEEWAKLSPLLLNQLGYRSWQHPFLLRWPARGRLPPPDRVRRDRRPAPPSGGSHLRGRGSRSSRALRPPKLCRCQPDRQ